MKTSIVLSLDGRYEKSDGTCSIVLRITHYQKVAQIVTGIYVKKSDWDDNGRRIKPSYRGTQSVTRLNNFLQKKKAEAIDIITKLDERKGLDSLTVIEVKMLIERPVESISFFEYGNALVEEMTEAGKIGNARAYRGTLTVFKSFANGKNLSFREITHALLTRFEQGHLKKGGSLNGLSVYLRTVRAIFNHAIKKGVIEQELYPFRMYEIKSTKTRKRAISIEAIRKIEALALGPEHALFHARNYFLASFYLRGISFTDLAHLKLSDVIDGRIHYDRQKTDKPYDIVITSPMQSILDIYTRGKEKGDFVFPVITATEPERQYSQVLDARKRFNKKLKRIGELCGIGENLTSYVSRHSFATRAKNLGIPIASISDMLGHSDTRTTEVYLDSLPSDILDDFHKRVVE